MRRRSIVIVGALAMLAASFGTSPVHASTPAPTFADVMAFGSAPDFGSTRGALLHAPIVGLARTPEATGYWEAASDGGVFAFGNAPFRGSMGGRHLNQPIVGIAGTLTGRGYWLVARDGGIFTFGNAHFYGSLGGTHLNQPIIGMAATATGNGYWLVARDGGIFTFGDAHFYGSLGRTHLNQPVVAMAPIASGKGYRLAARDGGVFNFGKARPHGPLFHGRYPIVGISTSTPGDLGYWLVDNVGHTFPFGNAPHLPGASTAQMTKPIVAIVATPGSHGYWLAGRGNAPGGAAVPGQVVIGYAGQAGGSGEIAVEWNAVFNATGYRVSRSLTPGGPFVVAAKIDLTTGMTFRGPGVRNLSWHPSPPSPGEIQHFQYIEEITTPNVRRYYQVTAYSPAGSGPPSETRCGAPPGYPDC